MRLLDRRERASACSAFGTPSQTSRRALIAKGGLEVFCDRALVGDDIKPTIRDPFPVLIVPTRICASLRCASRVHDACAPMSVRTGQNVWLRKAGDVTPRCKVYGLGPTVPHLAASACGRVARSTTMRAIKYSASMCWAGLPLLPRIIRDVSSWRGRHASDATAGHEFLWRSVCPMHCAQ